MYIIFRGVPSNIFDHPVEAMMGMFIMSLGEFGDIYESFARTPMDELPKVRINLIQNLAMRTWSVHCESFAYEFVHNMSDIVEFLFFSD